MHPFFADCYETLQRLHKDMEAALEGLPPGALDWEPGEGMNSLAVLASHTAGAERYWIGVMLAGDDSERVRADEFEASNTTAEGLIARLREVLAHTGQTLTALTLDDLTQASTSPMHEREFSFGFSLTHAIEHTAAHAGHMQITRQLWEQREG